MTADVSNRHLAHHGTTGISFELVRRPRRRTLGIEVLRDGTVRALAPAHLDEAEVHRLVASRGAWILRHQRRLAVLPPPPAPPQYVSGESWRYLGDAYRLRVLPGDAEGVEVLGGELLLTVRTPERAEIILERWLRERAQAVLSERMAFCLERAVHFGIHHSGEFRLRRMRTRWGSCTQTGRLNFNSRLVQAPEECIDYVVVHELCHLAEFNHGPGYYRLLDRVMPDWRRRRERLNRLVEVP